MRPFVRENRDNVKIPPVTLVAENEEKMTEVVVVAATGSLCACMRSYRYKFSVFAEKKKIVDILIELPDRHL